MTSIKKDYYAVSVHKGENSTEVVGYYFTKQVAEKVVSLICTPFSSQVPIRATITPHSSELTRHDTFYRSEGSAALMRIQNFLSTEEVIRILELIPSVPKPSPRGICDEPKRIVEGECHTVYLDFAPFDGSRKLTVGYYQSEAAARRVISHITLAHQNEKVGKGFNMGLSKLACRKFVEYTSGRRHVLLDNVSKEVEPSCQDFLKVSRKIADAIQKWS